MAQESEAVSVTPPKNPLAIGCPRPGCKCTIIRANVATLVQRNPQTQQPDGALPAVGADILLKPELPVEVAGLFSSGGASGWYWMLTDMMDFENVGFSHKVGDLKFLSCADCDLAPLGYHNTSVESADKEFLVAADRVVYR
ncbi:hypothetical protein GGI25_003584 [Coemansia spiralis]|uniref:Mss4-like protein n=2 Tax=Coemansia TaxID=4863 RepID=A0A9W8KXF1_9FUNG|nr:Mss4-like protein [Coemansia spiralis]KAJ1991140.1 hypothetical protein EDC05_003618 [Coemansia umbellata]KAJ2621283.1 hypothetical protein GGI26_004257 [Coemansia sp. RSA 1358]KAJ2676434.1 hypothetical protein GGI25_003584 [Coemansia spiralis]